MNQSCLSFSAEQLRLNVVDGKQNKAHQKELEQGSSTFFFLSTTHFRLQNQHPLWETETELKDFIGNYIIKHNNTLYYSFNFIVIDSVVKTVTNNLALMQNIFFLKNFQCF